MKLRNTSHNETKLFFVKVGTPGMGLHQIHTYIDSCVARDNIRQM